MVAAAGLEAVVKTYPINTSSDDRLVAFEVEAAYISPTDIGRLLSLTPGVSEVKRRRLFSDDGDVHVRFMCSGHRCIVWEPYGDSSRYWIGPEQSDTLVDGLLKVKRIFDEYKPPIHRMIFGDVLSMRFLKKDD